MTYADDIDEPNVVEFTAGAGSGVGRLQKAARANQAGDDVSGHLNEARLAEIGAKVVADWELDLASNKDWRKTAEESLDIAAQEHSDVVKTHPFSGASDVQYPLLTIAAQAFSSRAYPAIVKGDEAIKIKTFGKDADGRKAKRATRMADYLNYTLFYEVDGWEADTDALLLRLPITGQQFRKVWWDPLTNQCCVESISPLRLTIPADARSLKASPRITHDFDRYPYELQSLMAAGHFRKVVLVKEGEDDQGKRLMLEQHLLMDLDNDGLDEPYVVTVDRATEQVLRIEEAFDDDGITENEAGEIVSIQRWCPFVGYNFIPDPKGRAYAIGFGHLLSEIMAVINTNINLMIDAGHAQVAGGGFIAQEIRLQGAGQNGVLKFQPAEYKTVAASGTDLRNGIYERNFPEPSPVLFQLLGMLMEAAKDIASVNDAITGDAARSAPVGTTLALIEQGQQVFNAIYKRVYRSLREEFSLFVDCLRKYGNPADYARFCDEDIPDPTMMGHNGGPPMTADPVAPPASATAPPGLMGAQPQGQGMMPPQAAPQAVQPAPAPPMSPEELFKADFAAGDDVRPVSDPGSITKMQRLGKAQFALSFLGKGIYKDDRLVVREALIDAGIDQAEEWIPDQAPPPDPVQLQILALKAELEAAKAKQALADAVLKTAQAAEISHQNSGAEREIALAHKAAETTHLQTQSAHLASTINAPDEPAPLEPAA